MLSETVMTRVVCLCDQAARVGFLLASKRTRAAACHPDAWRKAWVFRPCDRAVEFLGRMGTKDIRIQSADATGIRRFLCAVHPGVTTLVLRLHDAAFPPRLGMLEPLARQTELHTLVVLTGGLPDPACLVLPPLPRLTAMVCVDTTWPRKLEVYFEDSCMPALQQATLDVSTSDILARAHAFRALTNLVYLPAEDTFEDAQLDDMSLHTFKVMVPTASAFGFLMSSASRARCIRYCTLMCASDVVLDTHVPIRNLVLKLMKDVEDVDVVHAVVRGMESLCIEAATPGTVNPWTVRFVGAGSWANFYRHMMNTTLRIGVGGRVIMDPS